MIQNIVAPFISGHGVEHLWRSLACVISPKSLKGVEPKNLKFAMCSYPAGFATTRYCLRFPINSFISVSVFIALSMVRYCLGDCF